MIEQWFADYRSGDLKRTEMVKMQINTMLRRALLADLNFLRAPVTEQISERLISSAHIRHLVEMARFIMEK